jgi:hypothetical protein
VTDIDTLFSEDRRYPPDPGFAAQANAQPSIYVEGFEAFWEREGRERLTWFEDFGEGALVCGEASIALDADFAAVVDASKYHVFLTAHKPHADLAVTERSPDGFQVRASEGAEGTFSWRVVAKRKDIAAPRFEPVEIPLEPAMPPIPPSATATEPPPMPPLPGRPE